MGQFAKNIGDKAVSTAACLIVFHDCQWIVGQRLKRRSVSIALWVIEIIGVFLFHHKLSHRKLTLNEIQIDLSNVQEIMPETILEEQT